MPIRMDCFSPYHNAAKPDLLDCASDYSVCFSSGVIAEKSWE